MFYATDMLPCRQKVYKDYKIYKPKCINMMFYTWKKREKKRHTQRDQRNTLSSKMSKEIFSC